MKRVGAFRFARATKPASVNTIIKASRHPTPLLTIDLHCSWTFISNLFSSHLRRIHKSHSFFYLPSGLLCVLTMASLLEDPKDPCVKVLVSKGVMVKSLRGRAQVKEGSVIDCGALAFSSRLLSWPRCDCSAGCHSLPPRSAPSSQSQSQEGWPITN